MATPLPDISSMKLSEIKSELSLYGIDSSHLLEKSEFTSALQNARDTLPRPSTSYKPAEEEPKKKSKSSRSTSGGGGGGVSNSSSSTAVKPSSMAAPAAASSSSASAPSVTTTTATTNTTATNNKKLLAQRSPLKCHQQIREHPSERILRERSSSFLPGSPFSFSLKGSIFESDAAILRIPEGVCLTIQSASVERKSMEEFLKQKGSIGVSLQLSTEENPTLLPIWTFDGTRSTSYSVCGLGIRCAGPRTVRLMAWMEMGFRSGASVDVNVFGSVALDGDKF